MSFQSFYYKKYLTQIGGLQESHKISDKKFVVENISRPTLFSGRTETLSCSSEKINRSLFDEGKSPGFYLNADKLIGGHRSYKSVQLSFLSTRPCSMYNNYASDFLGSLSRLSILTEKKKFF